MIWINPSPKFPLKGISDETWCRRSLMPLFHQQYQLTSPWLSVAQLGLVSGTLCFHLESISVTWTGRHSTHARNCDIYATHYQTVLCTEASPPLSRSTACSCALIPPCSIIDHYCWLNADASIQRCLVSGVRLGRRAHHYSASGVTLANQWPVGCLRYDQISSLGTSTEVRLKKYQTPGN